MTAEPAKPAPLRPLLPKRKRDVLSPEPSEAASVSKRAVVPAACEPCRARKIKVRK